MFRTEFTINLEKHPVNCEIVTQMTTSVNSYHTFLPVLIIILEIM